MNPTSRTPVIALVRANRISRSHRLYRKSRTAVALVMTLAMIVLVTVLIVAFYSYATANRQIETSRSNQIKAEQVARSGMDYVVQQFMQEISNPSYSTALTANGGPSVYQPLYSTNGVPARIINSTITSSDANFFTLIRQSIPTADASASADNTATASGNSRLISAARWNMPTLLGGSGFTAANQLPNWINLDKVTGPTATISGNVIGRFSYNVYDIGGLLDANVAGYPSGETPSALKGTVAGANLTALGATQAAVDLLRNGFCGPGGGVYADRVTTFAKTGFLATTATNTAGLVYKDSYFLNRQDLIRYVQTQNPGLAPALPYLTAFSRSVNAPSWGPTANLGGSYNYQTIANTTTSTNRFFPNVRYYDTTDPSSVPIQWSHYADDGTYTTNFVSAGDPLIQRRFSLAKLAWLTHTGASTTAFKSTLSAPQKAAAILACFGLRWNAAHVMSGTSTTVAGWEYLGSSGLSTVQNSIETLDNVASEDREPNFFELLKAGILTGSLGQTGCTSSTDLIHGVSVGNIYADTVNTDYQIIRIGANLIDQYKSDSYPTPITFGAAGYTFWGMEDLPYFHQVGTYVHQANPTSGPTLNYIIFGLWNPHAPSASSTAGPSSFRVRVATNGISPPNYVLTYEQPPVPPLTTNPLYPYPSGIAGTIFSLPPVAFKVGFSSDRLGTDTQRSYREPHLLRDTSTTASYNTTILCNPMPLPPVTSGVAITYVPTAGQPNTFEMVFNSTVFILDYQDTDGVTWRPYATFVGHEEDPTFTGQTYTHVGMQADIGTGTPPTTTFLNAGCFIKADPRTYRFDAQWGRPPDSSLRPSGITLPTSGILNYIYPFFFGSAGARMAYLASNNKSYTSNYYPDGDGVVRPADDYNGDVNPYAAGTSTTPNYMYRPIILNHPFTSVADMGYAFRDLPFRSLDFSSSSSADAGLLDLFALNDQPAVVAGQVSLNTPLPVVQQSLLTNAAGIPDTTVANLITKYQTYAFGSNRTPTPNIPLTTADLSKYLNYYDTQIAAADTKSTLEAPVRALSSMSQSRTWNLLIDVVAQVGTFPKGVTAASGFIVQGEKRYWLSIAIDRYTGKIVDQQLEIVNE